MAPKRVAEKKVAPESGEDRLQLIAQLQAELAALNAKVEALVGWIPAHRFLNEPLPTTRSSYFKIIDIFNGNVAGHLVWTHVHSCGNVRSSTRPDHVQVYTPHGWNDMPAEQAARDALDALPTRLALMWIRLDERQKDALMAAARKFAETHTVAMDKETFGVASSPMIATTNNLVSEIARQFLEYGDMGRE